MKEHKFFERQIDINNINSLEKVLLFNYKKIVDGQLIKGEKNEQTPWNSSGSESTINWNKYNVFQIYDPNIHNLFRALRDMTIDACNYYDLDFIKEQFMVQGWFNINYTKKGKLDWHDHGPFGAPNFHGYYCVKAQPSVTYYKVFDKEVQNINIDNHEGYVVRLSNSFNYDDFKYSVAKFVRPNHVSTDKHWKFSTFICNKLKEK